MAHFPVLVISPEQPSPEKLEGVMAPYRSFNSTGEGNCKYVLSLDITEEAREEYKRSHQEDLSFLEYLEAEYDYPVLGVGEVPDLEGSHKWGWIQVNAQGEVEEIFNRTNPNAKWDWWVVGGRWHDFFLLKEGGRRFYMAQKGSIDFEKMRGDIRSKASKEWDLLRPVLKPFLNSFRRWEDVKKEFPLNTEEVYYGQPLFKEIERKSQEDITYFQLDIEPFFLDKEVYIEREISAELCFYAYILDGQWEERGIESISNWGYLFNTMLKNIPDDHWLTIIDCHF